MPHNPPNSTVPILSIIEARRFLLAHHGLYPARNSKGKEGILDYIQHTGCIQFDPINIVGRNPDLVLQSRVQDYKPVLLDELLYQERQLADGWDKMAAIYRMEDWHKFWLHRDHVRTRGNTRRPNLEILDEVLEQVSQRGPLCSLDFEDTEKIDWFWSPTRASRAALEHLYAIGKLGIHHRVNNRRYFDLIERLVPPEHYQAQNPFASQQAYREWHILRRIGGMGMVDDRAGDYWLGILGVKSPERKKVMQRLLERGGLLQVEIEGLPGNPTFYIRSQDWPTLEAIRTQSTQPKAAFIAALDNLTWNRGLIQQMFDFEYTWEVYKPKAQRVYGYYVLPVLYGERFIARFEPGFDKKTRVFTMKNWWWEPGVEPDAAMEAALAECLGDFAGYLQAEQVVLEQPLADETRMAWASSLCG